MLGWVAAVEINQAEATIKPRLEKMVKNPRNADNKTSRQWGRKKDSRRRRTDSEFDGGSFSTSGSVIG